jgi:hypothetical protein
MSSKSWRFGDKELAYIKEVLDSGFGCKIIQYYKGKR